MIVHLSNALLTAALIALAITPLTSQQPQKPPDSGHVCDEAQIQAEMTQCAGKQYRKADARLNAAYHKALEFMQTDLSDAQNHKDADQIKYNQEAIAKLKAAERAWIQYRDLHCEAARHQYEGGSMSPMVWASCMEQTAWDRIEELKSAYENGDRKLE